MAQETGKQADTKDISIDVIIPTYKPDERFIRLLELLGSQTRPVSKILIINTEKEYYDWFFERRSIPWSVRDITEVIHIKKEDFDHGGTRRMAVQKSNADFFVMMTQDALPYDNTLIKELTEPLLLDPRIAVSYSTGTISIFPSSILEKSRIVLMIDKSVFPELCILAAYSRISGWLLSRSTISFIPRIALIGVRIS